MLAEADIEHTAHELVRKLGGEWHGKSGIVRCPAHDDDEPSLSITPGHSAVLFHCFAGCTREAVMRALRARRLDARVSVSAEPREAKPRQDLRELVRSIWSAARPLTETPAMKYLDLRGLGAAPFGRFAPRCLTYVGARKVTLPALLLPVEDEEGLQALQRNFLDPITGAKSRLLVKSKRMLGDPRGGAIRIGRIEDGHLHIAEGFEDAVSAMLINALPGCWAACGVERYATLAIPPAVNRITLWSQHGKAAEQGIERARAHLCAGERTLMVEPPPPGGDWNDALRVLQGEPA